jgi:hypothetical protein
MLLEGQWAVPTPRAAIVAISSSLSQIACASVRRGPRKPILSRWATVVVPYFSLTSVHLGRALGGVDRHARLVAIRERLGAQERLGPDGVGGVRPDRRHDQRVPRPLLEEGLGDAQALVGVLEPRDRVVHHRRGAEAAQARLLRGLGHQVLVEVHVGERRGAGADHLPGREAGAPGDELRRDVGRFGRPDVLS